MKRTIAQNYPRIADEKSKYYGFLDEEKLADHGYKPTLEELKEIIQCGIVYANLKSSRAILNIPEEIADEDLQTLYKKEGKELFKYFVKYCGDPASTAYDCLGRHYSEIAKEQFRNRTLQKERMNSGWRYQYIAYNTAITTKRFYSVSDAGKNEADFNAVIDTNTTNKLNIFVSVKNRTNTMGGQDWPKAIRALEDVAKNDRNKYGSYICVFGIAMEKRSKNN